MDNGIRFDLGIGVSAGSANLISYCAGQRGRNYHFYVEYSMRKEYASVGNFLRHVVAAFPYAVECVQADNGPEFTNRLHSSGTAKLTVFEKTLAELGIRYKPIRPLNWLSPKQALLDFPNFVTHH